MEVEFRCLDSRPVSVTPRTSGYQAAFRSASGTGHAVIVPANDDFTRLQRARLDVETGYREIEAFAKAGRGCEPAMTETSEGDYRICGVVSRVPVEEPGVEDHLVVIDANEWNFDLSDEDFAGVKVKEGDLVTFIARGLVLYDCGH